MTLTFPWTMHLFKITLFIYTIYREATVQERNNTLLVCMSLKQEKNGTKLNVESSLSTHIVENNSGLYDKLHYLTFFDDNRQKSMSNMNILSWVKDYVSHSRPSSHRFVSFWPSDPFPGCELIQAGNAQSCCCLRQQNSGQLPERLNQHKKKGFSFVVRLYSRSSINKGQDGTKRWNIITIELVFKGFCTYDVKGSIYYGSSNLTIQESDYILFSSHSACQMAPSPHFTTCKERHP